MELQELINHFFSRRDVMQRAVAAGIHEGDTDEDDLAENIDRKVLYCNTCEEEVGKDEAISINDSDDARPRKCCPGCYTPLSNRKYDRLPNPGVNTLGYPVLAPATITNEHPRSEVTRSFTSPYGKVTLCLDTTSVFSPWVRVEEPETERPKRLLAKDRQKLTPCHVIRGLINSGFSNEAEDMALGVLDKPGTNVYERTARWHTFVRRIRAIIREVHEDAGKTLHVEYRN